MLFDQYPRREALFCIPIKHWNNPLRDDWPAIKCFVNEVHSAPAPLHAVCNSLSLRVKAGETRKQAWMNIKNAILKSLDEARRQQAHVAGKANKIHTFCLQARY